MPDNTGNMIRFPKGQLNHDAEAWKTVVDSSALSHR